jgi:hypothetical protein
MAPSRQALNKTWFQEPWVKEKLEKTTMFQALEDEDSEDEFPEKYGEENHERNDSDSSSNATTPPSCSSIDNLDDLNNIQIVENEVRHALTDILDSAEEEPTLELEKRFPK